MAASENGRRGGDDGLPTALSRALTVAAELGEVLSSFDEYLDVASDDRPLVPVAVPEWGGRVVLLRAMGSRERDDWQIRFIANDPIEPDQARREALERQHTYGERLLGDNARLVARSIVGPDGERIFSDAQTSFLEQRNSAVIDRLAKRAMELNGFTQADVEKLAEARAAGKDGSSSPSDAPSSG
jgi:hypothetical protein